MRISRETIKFLIEECSLDSDVNVYVDWQNLTYSAPLGAQAILWAKNGKIITGMSQDKKPS